MSLLGGVGPLPPWKDYLRRMATLSPQKEQWDTVGKRAVRSLLECFLVAIVIAISIHPIEKIAFAFSFSIA